MDMLKGLGSQFEKHAKNLTDKVYDLKNNYLGTVYDLPHYRVSVKRLIAEGGFGFVFFVTDVVTQRPFALKRMIVQDRERLKTIKNEIAIMSKNIVRIEDVKISESVSGTRDCEVLVLMEYCSYSLLGIPEENTNSALNEKEILKIFSQICEGVEFMHAQQPPVAHRDLKVENVLYQENDKLFKLCDFGSATTTTYLPTNERERSAAEEEINRNTTMVYRSPEMVDMYSNQRINEKADIWALGCILFKLAFNSDPFEAGKLAIINVKYTIPEFHKFSPAYLEYMAYLLNPQADKRPDIYQVQERLAQLRGVQYRKQFVPGGKPLPTVPGSAPVPEPQQQRPQAQSQPPSRPSAQPQTPKGLFDSLVEEQQHTSFNSPGHQQQRPQQQQRPAQPQQQPTQQPQPSGFDELVDWSDPAPTPAYHASASVPNNRSTPVQGGNTNNVSRSGGAIPTKAAAFDFDWNDPTPAPSKPTAPSTNKASPMQSVRSDPNVSKSSVIDDFDPFGTGASSSTQTHPAPATAAPTPKPPSPHIPKSSSAEGPDLLAFDEPSKPTPPGGKPPLSTAFGGLNMNATSQYQAPGYKLPPGYGPRPFYSPQPPHHPYAQPAYHSPQASHPQNGFPSYAARPPPQPNQPYSGFGPGKPAYGYGAPVPGAPGAPGLQIPPFKPQQQQPTRNINEIDDFDPLGPKPANNNNQQTNTTPAPSKSASELIDFF